MFSDIIEKTGTLLLAQCSHVSVDSWPSLPNMEGLQILPSAPLLLPEPAIPTCYSLRQT